MGMSYKKIRVLHVITGLSVGGAEMMLYKLLEALDHSKADSMVISLRSGGALGERIRKFEVPLVELNMRSGIPTPLVWRRLRNAVLTFKPDVIQGWMYHGNLAAWMTARWARDAALIWSVRQSLCDLSFEKKLTRLVIRANAVLSRRPRWILYNSVTSAHQHEAAGYEPAKTRLIPNGFDCDQFRPDPIARAGVRTELGLNQDTLLVGHIARYHPMKDHANFLRAASILTGRCPLVRFLMAGTGVDRTNMELMSQVRDFGLSERAYLLGGRHDMPRLTAALDLACSSSSWGEGFPNVLGESMASGVPCVATDVGDSGAIIGNTGQMVPARNPEALAAAIMRVLELPETQRRELGSRARERVQRKFSLQSVAQDYMALYESLNIETANTGRV